MQQQDGSATATHPLQVGPQPLNTPEELRAIRQAMGEGKNPLIATDVPRWEDQVGVSRIINRRVLELEPLPTPAQVLAELPLTDKAQEIVAYSRDEIRACLYGQDDRLLVIVGPCSVHDPQAALDYAHRLAALKDELGEQLLIVMRVYFEKPRTTVGWKGLINDPDIDGSHNGKNYVAYTFYIRNAGKTDLGYSAKLKVVSASKGVEKAARVRVYRNGEPTTYAATAADGNPEPNTEPFASKDVVTTISHKTFRVGDVDKYTVVIWLDGDDPECVDKIIGGAVEFGFDFDSSETDDTSLFIKFVEDIADTLTGNDPISASGNEAPDYYKEHNVTWSNRRNQKNSPAGDGDK